MTEKTLMRHQLLIAVLCVISAGARAATPIPSELVGIWTTHGKSMSAEIRKSLGLKPRAHYRIGLVSARTEDPEVAGTPAIAAPEAL